MMVRSCNPIRQLRLERGLSARQLADALDVSVTEIREAEKGNVRTPRRILEALAACGFDADAIARAYDDWRKEVVTERAAAARAKLLAGGAR